MKDNKDKSGTKAKPRVYVPRDAVALIETKYRTFSNTFDVKISDPHRLMIINGEEVTIF